MKYALARLIFKILGLIFFAKRLPGIPVLLYHAIGDNNSKLFISEIQFERQMRFLAKYGYRSVLPPELENVKSDEKVFLITFDDGFKSVHEVVLPLMNKYGFRGTVFVSTDYIGLKSRYAKNESDGQFDLLDEQEIKDLRAAGWCIANHFASHRNLTKLTVEEITDEYQRAGNVLERLGAVGSKLIAAYPFNRYNEMVWQVLREAGVQMAFNGGNRLCAPRDNPLALPRIEVDNNFSRFALIFSPLFQKLKMKWCVYGR